MVLATELKEQGNQAFKEGDFEKAEELYTEAIAKNTKDHALFRNRALVRLKQTKFHGAENDARLAASLSGPKSDFTVKAQYYLIQALLGLNRPQEALTQALATYKVSLDIQSSNTEVLSQIVMRAKQAVWKAKEVERIRGGNQTLAKMESLLDEDLERNLNELKGMVRNGEIGNIGYEEDKAEAIREADERKALLREAFSKIAGDEYSERTVPDWLIDPITFEIMQDPVMTISGHSFDRHNITKHITANGVDPISRQKMSVKDLRPNYALKAACSEFVDKNGWAVDY